MYFKFPSLPFHEEAFPKAQFQTQPWLFQKMQNKTLQGLSTNFEFLLSTIFFKLLEKRRKQRHLSCFLTRAIFASYIDCKEIWKRIQRRNETSKNWQFTWKKVKEDFPRREMNFDCKKGERDKKYRFPFYWNITYIFWFFLFFYYLRRVKKKILVIIDPEKLSNFSFFFLNFLFKYLLKYWRIHMPEVTNTPNIWNYWNIRCYLFLG